MLVQVFLKEDIFSSENIFPKPIFVGSVKDPTKLKIPFNITNGKKVSGPFTRVGFLWHEKVFYVLG